jgi:hypothetical protein
VAIASETSLGPSSVCVGAVSSNMRTRVPDDPETVLSMKPAPLQITNGASPRVNAFAHPFHSNSSYTNSTTEELGQTNFCVTRHTVSMCTNNSAHAICSNATATCAYFKNVACTVYDVTEYPANSRRLEPRRGQGLDGRVISMHRVIQTRR